MSFCSQCGSENQQNAKFCVNCGAKLEQAEASGGQSSEGAYFDAAPEWNTQFDNSAQTDGAQEPVFEKVTEFEEFTPDPLPNFQQSEININYGGGDNGYQQNYGNPAFETQTAQSVGTGNIGVSVASLVCGIISLLCCCTGIFSAVLGIAAVVLGIVSIKNKYDGKGLAIAGIVTGGIAVVVLVIAMILSGTKAFSNAINDVVDDYLW